MSSGGAVIEQGLAEALGLHVGDTISLGGHRFHVVGIALSTARPFYPGPVARPGLADARTTPRAWPPRASRSGTCSTSSWRPTPPSTRARRAANAFCHRSAATCPPAVEPVAAIRADDYRVIALDQKVLLIGSWLLAMLAIASIAVLVGGRMAEQTRRVGLLKAVGGTPALGRRPCCWPRTCCSRSPRRSSGCSPARCSRPHWPARATGCSAVGPSPPLTLATVVLVSGRACRRRRGHDSRPRCERRGRARSAPSTTPRSPPRRRAAGDRAVRGAAGAAAARRCASSRAARGEPCSPPRA